MHVTRLADAKTYFAPNHNDMRCLRLQGHEAGPADLLWLGMSQILPGGHLAALLGKDHIQVNSSHGQGVKQLAPGLRIEAIAPDGLVEAFSLEEQTGFAICVQWHPEWQAELNPISTTLFQAFGAACSSYQDQRRAGL